jgi:hypothetical protein
MNKAIYFLMPTEGLPDKLVKMVGDKVCVAWKAFDGNHHETFSTQVFIEKKDSLMREIPQNEYEHLYATIFDQYTEEKASR